MIEKTPEHHAQDGNKGDAVCYGHYFGGCYDFWVLESKKLDNGDYELYGVCSLYDVEYGYQLLSELKNITFGYGAKIEIEKAWKPTKLKDIPQVKEFIGENW